MKIIGTCLVSVPLLTVVLPLAGQEPAAHDDRKERTTITDSEFNRNARTDDLTMMLVQQLGKSEAEARDAASKLAQVGKSAVPILADLMERGPSEQVKHFAVVALSRIRHPSGAEALLPLVNNVEADRAMRLMAIDAVASSNLDSAAAPLARLAGGKDDAELRMKALQALSVMPVAWRDGEDLFVQCLGDPDGEIRSLALKVCFYAAAVKIVYGAAEPKLLEMVERDESMTIRCQALRALARMKSGRSVPLSVRLVMDRLTAEDLRRQAMAAILTVTEVPLKDSAAVERWWEKHGKMRYENAPALRPFTIKVAKEEPAQDAGAAAKAGGGQRAVAPHATTSDEVQKEPRAETASRSPARGTPPEARTSSKPEEKKRLLLEDGNDTPIQGLPIR